MVRWIGAYLAAKQPCHEVRVSTWLGEDKVMKGESYKYPNFCGFFENFAAKNKNESQNSKSSILIIFNMRSPVTAV